MSKHNNGSLTARARTRTRIDYISADWLGDLYDAAFIACIYSRTAWHGMAWHAAHLADFGGVVTDPSLLAMAMRHLGKERAGRNWRIVCIDCCVFFSLVFVVQLFHITSQHSTLCIMYASQPASLTWVRNSPVAAACARTLEYFGAPTSPAPAPSLRLHRYCTSTLYSLRKPPAQVARNV